MTNRRLFLDLADNNGRPARLSMWCPAGASYAGALGFLAALRGPLLALTQNRLLGGSFLVEFPQLGTPAAAPAADSRRSATLFYRNGAEIGRLIVPSPVPGLAELTGPWAGFRITRESAAAAGLLDDIEAIVAGAVQQNGNPWPPQFDTGAIDERV